MSRKSQRVGQAAQVEGRHQGQADDQFDVLAEAEERQPAPAVFGQRAGHDLGLGFRRVEGRQFQLAHQADQRHHEADRLGERSSQGCSWA